MTSPSTEQRAVEEAVFEVALSIDDASARELFLARTFQGDPSGLKRMKDLIESSRESASFFLDARDNCGTIAAEIFEETEATRCGTPVTRVPDNRTGTVIDCYKLGRCLGEGGSGMVYEAEQQHPVQRMVALKIVRIDTRSASAQARFDIERQALAIMDHPNIAKVLDAGGILDGTAYFVMELVKGESITSYCDREKLGIRERIRLYIDVCSAIQHAHSKGIIHRDIKPSNILVTTKDNRPVPKVIDFGIAKAEARTARKNDAHTGHDQFFGTPAYMSPEQVAMIGVDIDTRSDIYSLGVLLYEILTSHTPFDRRTLAGSGVSAMRDILRDRPHPKPSAVIALKTGGEDEALARARGTDPKRLTAMIRGDLDWIVMKALDKDRNRRYETANGLGMDLKRYLENKPVTARRSSNLYSFRKFIQRNRVTVYAAIAVSASVLMGFGTSTTLYFREKSALAEQARLSGEVAESRDQELHLRRQAQARANVSRAAFLLSEGHVEDADKLIQSNPIQSIEPSAEAAVVFRALGRWYANYGRWEESVQCFQLMAQASSLSTPGSILRSADLLSTGPAILELGDHAAYETFRNGVVTGYLPAQSTLEAEHALKACLLTEASPALLASLSHAADMCAASVAEKFQTTHLAWESFSLSLYHHRAGEHAKVLETAETGLTDPTIKEVCAIMLRILMAIAYHETGDSEKAAATLVWADANFHDLMRKNPEEGIYPGKWYDWSIAARLLREARARLEAPRH